jgi:hypothetical protein
MIFTLIQSENDTGVENILGLFIKLYHNAMPTKGVGDTYL